MCGLITAGAMLELPSVSVVSAVGAVLTIRSSISEEIHACSSAAKVSAPLSSAAARYSSLLNG